LFSDDALHMLLSIFEQGGGLFAAIVAGTSIALAAVSLFFEWLGERRARATFSIERRRLSEVNIRLEYSLHLTPVTRDAAGVAKSHMILHLPLRNIGDGPVDILALLISSRLLSARGKAGVGSRSRDVAWDDYERLYWSDHSEGVPFAGISTTKHVVSSPDDYIRLSAKEEGVLRRIDAVSDFNALTQSRGLVVMYRVFAVARGYPLGEILRQLGGGPPDPSVNVEQGRLQFQGLAQPDYHRWRTVQQALFNLNRLAFRLAIYDDDAADPAADPDASADPLGILADQDAWRIFLLHHWEFVDEATAAPDKWRQRKVGRKGSPLPDFTTKLQDMTEVMKREWYPDLVLPPDWHRDHERLRPAQAYCRTELAEFVVLWRRMRMTIAACQAYRRTPGTWEPYADDGYPALIHHAPHYRHKLGAEALRELDYAGRWFALMQEGYLVSKPFQRRRRIGRLRVRGRTLLRGIPLWRRRGYDHHDIPEDPRSLEPFVMRTHYLLSAGPNEKRALQTSAEERRYGYIDSGYRKAGASAVPPCRRAAAPL
jgi:hypothetical protein